LTIQTWLFFCATETVLCFIPGSAVLFVVSSALTRGTRGGLLGSLGILAANAAYFILSAMGLGAVLLASRTVFIVIKWIGAAYLVYIGIRMVVSRSKKSRGGASPGVERSKGVFWNGFVTQAANPKAIIFFTALLPQFIDPDQPAAMQIGILGVSSVLIEFVVLSIYVGTCRAAKHWVRGPWVGDWLTRAAGLLLIAAGVKLAATRGN
jgi:threonine/homoserine/homoserine lactone efflux protein